MPYIRISHISMKAILIDPVTDEEIFNIDILTVKFIWNIEKEIHVEVSSFLSLDLSYVFNTVFKLIIKEENDNLIFFNNLVNLKNLEFYNKQDNKIFYYYIFNFIVENNIN